MEFESKCKLCGQGVSRKPDRRCKNVFCSSSCAAKYNNKQHPKRSPENRCKSCGEPISTAVTYCKVCYGLTLIAGKQYKELTRNKNYQRNSQVREHARKSYWRSDLTKQCLICGYDKHVDVCHVKEISAFPDDALISEINDLSNLIALCKNHHWEYDRRLMEENDLRKIDLHLLGR